MKGDFSRVTFDPALHVSRVMLQQGRVLLDADFNLQSAVAAHGLRRLTRDLLGPHAGPANPGFLVKAATDANGKLTGGLAFDAGRYYVDGLAAESDAAFEMSLNDLGMKEPKLHLLYLDVWEEHVTWLEDNLVREPGLGGPDTTTQARIRSLVRAAVLTDEVKNDEDWVKWYGANLQRSSRGLKAPGRVIPQLHPWTDSPAADDDVPCVADPAGGYRGLENQLYRVEIHAPGSATKSGKPTFKWSRDNGSVAAAWVGVDGDDLIVDGIHDTAHGFAAGQWVELTSVAPKQHADQLGTMVRLTKVDGVRLTVDKATPWSKRPSDDDHPIVRRWDHRELARDPKSFEDGAIELTQDQPYMLEAGIKILFPSLDPGDKRVIEYGPGDYWLIPARAVLGDILWPQIAGKTGKDRFVPREPEGPEHVYAPLATVEVAAADGKPSVKQILQLKIAPPVIPV